MTKAAVHQSRTPAQFEHSPSVIPCAICPRDHHLHHGLTCQKGAARRHAIAAHSGAARARITGISAVRPAAGARQNWQARGGGRRKSMPGDNQRISQTLSWRAGRRRGWVPHSATSTHSTVRSTPRLRGGCAQPLERRQTSIDHSVRGHMHRRFGRPTRVGRMRPAGRWPALKNYARLGVGVTPTRPMAGAKQQGAARQTLAKRFKGAQCSLALCYCTRQAVTAAPPATVGRARPREF